ncbi:syntaxin-6 [Crotalus adamanteus]|uniref:Syntaxin-6 n=1 Tax=Crotalus adamanteus TaxID=8729 RepID=A0AAW1BPC6_CROAD
MQGLLKGPRVLKPAESGERSERAKRVVAAAAPPAALTRRKGRAGSCKPWKHSARRGGQLRAKPARRRAPGVMSMEDPFFVVKGEVQKAVNTAQGLFQRWTELLQDPSTATREEIDWTTNELRNNLRSIEWDLEDLDETISIVEANPRKFNLDATELDVRKAFITSTRQVVRDMKDQMSNTSVQALAEKKNRQVLLGESRTHSWSSRMDKYSRLDRELQSANSHFIEDQQAQQQLIIDQQDEQLELVSGSIGVLKNMSQRIGGELDEQAVMLDDFSHEVDSTQSRLDNVMKKLAKVSHMTNGPLNIGAGYAKHLRKVVLCPPEGFAWQKPNVIQGKSGKQLCASSQALLPEEKLHKKPKAVLCSAFSPHTLRATGPDTLK